MADPQNLPDQSLRFAPGPHRAGQADQDRPGLPPTHTFSQSQLQDYVDCARRFQLRYLLAQPWPDLIVDVPGEAELHQQRGAELHHLIRQHVLGLDPESLAATIHDPVLAGWWQTYLHHPPPDLPVTIRRAEIALTAPLAGFRLLAKYDLLAVEPGTRFVVVDWKTSSQPARRSELARRLQTRVYRFLAVEAGANTVGGRPPRPEQVEMVYWFASSGASERFPYDAEQHAADRAYLAGLIGQIVGRRQPIWELTADERRCRVCNYRSLCERRVRPAFLTDLEDEPALLEPEFDLEQIAEIEF
jgi:hypothetical protein